MTPPASDSAPQEDPVTIAGLLALVSELRAQYAALVARVTELERQLGLHSGNSASRRPATG